MAQYLANMPDDAKVLHSMSCKQLGLALGKLAASHGAEKLHGVHLGSTGIQVAQNLGNYTLRRQVL